VFDLGHGSLHERPNPHLTPSSRSPRTLQQQSRRNHFHPIPRPGPTRAVPLHVYEHASGEPMRLDHPVSEGSDGGAMGDFGRIAVERGRATVRRRLRRRLAPTEED
jgi:hypothetical protein